jgi:hypothetical protein
LRKFAAFEVDTHALDTALGSIAEDTIDIVFASLRKIRSGGPSFRQLEPD